MKKGRRIYYVLQVLSDDAVHNMHKFAAASAHETIAFGAAKPGYADAQVAQWIQFMQTQGIQRVCCLLTLTQLAPYSDLLKAYREAFGENSICWTPLEDFQLADRQILMEQILPFLTEADQQGDRVVVHCAGGIGRTGQVLAAWLVSQRGFSNQDAIAAVRRSDRNPHEAVAVALLKGQNPWKVAEAFNALLNECRERS
jgi:protein-tyrosine phosphatase